MAGEEEIRRLDAMIDKATDESLDSTRRILNTAANTQQIGVETLITLNEQGEPSCAQARKKSLGWTCASIYLSVSACLLANIRGDDNKRSTFLI